MSRMAPLVLLTLVLGACASKVEPAVEPTAAPALAAPAKMAVLVVGADDRPFGNGSLLCFPGVDDRTGTEAMARALRQPALTLVGAGRATIPADTSMAIFGNEGSFPIDLDDSTTTTADGLRLLRPVQTMRFVDLLLVDEGGHPLTGMAWPMSDGDFPRELPMRGSIEEGWPSAEDGLIRLALPWWPERGLWLLLASPGRAPRCVELPTTAPGRDRGAIRVVLERRREAATFAVDDRNGRIVKPFLVRFRPGSPVGGDACPEGQQLIEVGADGRFQLPLGGRRPFRLEVRAEGYEPWIDEAVQIETLEIRLRPLR